MIERYELKWHCYDMFLFLFLVAIRIELLRCRSLTFHLISLQRVNRKPSFNHWHSTFCCTYVCEYVIRPSSPATVGLPLDYIIASIAYRGSVYPPSCKCAYLIFQNP